jgi:hypothetical protein
VVLTAAFVTLVALPGVAGSQTPSIVRPLTAAAFQTVRLPASAGGSPEAIRPLYVGYESAELRDLAPLIETGAVLPTTERSAVVPRLPSVVSVIVPPPTAATKTATTKHSTTQPTTPKTAWRSVLSGLASWYDNGTTAMRLPYGTQIKICGAKGCVSRMVRDWGPARYLSNRVVDMIPEDFVRITGRSLSAGLAPVTVYVY